MIASETKPCTYFSHKGTNYMRIIPGKRMFNSTMVHEVINRGDIFAVSMKTGMFTAIKGTDTVLKVELKIHVENINYKFQLADEDRWAQGDLF